MKETLISGFSTDPVWQQIKQLFELDVENIQDFVEYAKFKPNPLLQALMADSNPLVAWIYYEPGEYQALTEKILCIFASWDYICADPEDDEYSFGVHDTVYDYDAKHFRWNKGQNSWVYIAG